MYFIYLYSNRHNPKSSVQWLIIICKGSFSLNCKAGIAIAIFNHVDSGYNYFYLNNNYNSFEIHQA